MMSLFDMLALSVALFVVLNILARLANKKRLHFAITFFFLAIIFAILLLMLYYKDFGTHMGFINVSQFSALIAAILTMGMIVVQLIAYEEQVYTDFSLLSSFSYTGILLVVMSTNLVTIFIGLALLTVPTVFALLLSRKWIEAGLKYFIVTALSASLFAFGAATLFFSTGNLQLSEQGYSLDSLIAFILFITSISIEAGIFPFNLWIPDVYQGGPAFITSMLGGLNKKVGLIALIYISILMFPFISQNLLLMFAVLTMFYGNLAALVQKNVKRILAYSSISQVGYILIGIASMSKYGVAASTFQIFAHVFAFIGAFAVVTFLERKGRKEVIEYIGLNKENTLASFALSLMLLSMIGMPFTAGFVGKFLLFSSAIYSNLAWLAVLGIINTVISIYYYAKIIIAVYTNREGTKPVRLGAPISIALLISIAIILVFGIYPGPLFNMMQAAAPPL